jgi:hypothetical protein
MANALELGNDKPDIVGDVLAAVNKEMMRQNELRLAQSNVAVDFDGVGTMPERLDRLFLAISSGLSCLNLKPALIALGAFPIFDRSETVRSAILFYSTLNEGDPTRYGRRFAFQSDARSQLQTSDGELLDAFAEQLRSVLKASSPGALDILAATYFVRPWVNSGSLFDVQRQVLCEFHSCGSLSAPTWPWIAATSGQSFVQRLVFFLVIPGDSATRSSFELHKTVLNGAFRFALGAFLSSAGVNADENTILFAQRVAAQSVLRAHEIANLTRFLLKQQNTLDQLMSDNAPPNDIAVVIQTFRKRFDWLLEVTNRLQETGSDANLEVLNWRKIIEQWSQDRQWRSEGDGRMRHSHIPGAELHLNFDQVKPNAYLSFIPAYFDRLLDILQRNTFDAWEVDEKTWQAKWSGPKVIRLTASQKNGSYIMLNYESTGPEIDPENVQRLFREVVESRKPGKSRGTGLWGLGLAFSSHGLPYPVARNIKGVGVEFVMAFPLVEN